MGKRSSILFCVVVCLLARNGHGYPSFQSQVPNGDNVPHPCIIGSMWDGLGHENPLGAGTRNAFGIDFKNNGLKWDATLCQKDSDGDGRTNGEELGDPDCTWTPGTLPKFESGITHPGVCEPLGSDQCRDKVSFVSCEAKEFDCPAVKEPDTMAFEARFPETPVPAKETTYICITFEFPTDKDYHLVASEPIISNKEVMHHTIVFGCTGDEPPTNELGAPFECGGEMDKCRDLIALWGAGGGGVCANENMGYLVGGTRGYKYAVMQHHWNNPMLRPDYTDSSGFTFYITPNLRPNNGGTLLIGQSRLAIPPNSFGHTETGTCTSDCMQEIMSGDIYVTAVYNHMHFLGKSQYTELRRNGSFVEYLAYDEVYDYNTPVAHVISPAKLVRRGDEFKTTCIFQSRGKQYTTTFGEATSDEMCLAFIDYYPKENLNTAVCMAWKSLDHCEFREHQVKRGCDFGMFFDYSNGSEMSQLSAEVSRKCTPFDCRQECLDLVRRLKSQPCFSGDVGDLARLMAIYYYTGTDEKKAQAMLWYTKLDSCDWELFQEGYSRQGDTGISSGAPRLFETVSIILASFGSFLTLLY